METQSIRTTHPLVMVAGIAIILFCALGVAAIMGWVPGSTGKSGEAPVIAAANQAPPQQQRVLSSSSSRPATIAESRQPATPSAVEPPSRVESAAIARCAECAVVESVHEVDTPGKTTGLGVAGGAVVGGLVGNQIGAGQGKNLLTVAGAVGGAIAGNQIEKKMKTTKNYAIAVRFEDGTRRVFHSAHPPSWRSGDRVRVIDGQLQAA